MIIGITGGVGSGKSTVLKYLYERYNAYIIEADAVAKEIMTKGHNVYNRVIEAFPEIELDSSGEIDRQVLASIVFNNQKKLELLNSIVHPGVKEQIKSTIQSVQNNTPERIIVIEAALLIEDGYKQICDVIWYVYCEKEERIRRLIESRGYTRSKAIEIMSNQMSEEEFTSNTDAFVDNSKSEEATHMQMDRLIAALVG